MKCSFHSEYKDNCNSCRLADSVNKARKYYDTFPQWQKDYYENNRRLEKRNGMR